MIDALLERLTYSPKHDELTPIPWPDGLGPKPVASKVEPGGRLPQADVLCVTWTSAESEALADVMTPGVHVTEWNKYTEKWPEYEKQLTGRSPAHYSKCMAEWKMTQVGNKRVLCAKSNLHLATDGTSMPIGQLWQQMIGEVDPSLIITTGTAGGIGADIVLGDVAIATAAQFNCQKAFKNKPYANTRYVSNFKIGSTTNLEMAESKLLSVNAGHLRPVATRDPKIWTGVDVETVDFFGFDDTADAYGIAKDDPQAKTEEMDDSTLGYALQQMYYATQFAAPPFLSVRNASDPMVPSSIGNLEKQKQLASQIYNKYGYWTTVSSAIVCWALIADFAL